MDGLPPDELAGFLGVRPDALLVSLLRAAERFADRLSPGEARPCGQPELAANSGDAPTEPARARALGHWLTSGNPLAQGAVQSPRELGLERLAPAYLLRLRASEVHRALEAARLRLESGPAARRGERIRRLLLVALVLGTLFLYWRGAR